MGFSEFIAFATLIITIITQIAAPFLQLPRLAFDDVSDFPLSKEDHTEKLTIKLHNYGIIKLNHIIVSIKADRVKFFGAASEPFLSKDFVVNDTIENQTDNAYFEIRVLPPQSDVTIISKMNITGDYSNRALFVNVRSDEWIGYPSWYIDTITVVSLILAIIFVGIFIFIWKKYDSFEILASPSHICRPGNYWNSTTKQCVPYHRPVVVDGGLVTLGKNKPKSIRLRCSDPEEIEDTILISIVEAPKGGTVDPTSVIARKTPFERDYYTAELTYTPHNDFVGKDEFTYKATDNLGADSENVTVQIRVVDDSRNPTEISESEAEKKRRYLKEKAIDALEKKQLQDLFLGICLLLALPCANKTIPFVSILLLGVVKSASGVIVAFSSAVSSFTTMLTKYLLPQN